MTTWEIPPPRLTHPAVKESAVPATSVVNIEAQMHSLLSRREIE
jgi:hypothetical protein